MTGRRAGFLVLLVAAVRLVAAPPEPIQKPVKLLGLGENVDREFAKLTDIGITPSLTYYGVFQGNPVGGIQQRTAYSQLILFGVELNFEKLVGLPGGSLTISGAQAMGENLSGYIGNINTVSDAFATPNTALFYQLYWKQMLFGEKLELRLGRMTAADQFASVPAFALQVNGGINSNPTSLFVNAPFHSAPNASWAASTKIQATNEFSVEGGIYQASQRLDNAGYHGLDFSIRANDGELAMVQIGWTPSFFAVSETPPFAESGNKSPARVGLPGIYLLGGYYSNFKFPELNGSKVQHSAYGFYAMGQQMLWRSLADPFTNFSVWAGLTFSPQEDISLLPLMGFAGTTWQGLVPGRDRDQLLLTYLASDFSRNHTVSVVGHGGHRPTVEHVLEAGYAIYISDNYMVQPDIQYVVRPNGVSNIRNSLVIGIQFIASY
jgi:porin